jgi:hypothetical protein
MATFQSGNFRGSATGSNPYRGLFIEFNIVDDSSVDVTQTPTMTEIFGAISTLFESYGYDPVVFNEVVVTTPQVYPPV